MNTDLLKILRDVIAKNGETVLAEPRRISALLADLAAEVPKPQKTALVKCLEQGFVQVLKNSEEPERDNCKQRLAQKLRDEEGLDLGLCGEILDLLEKVLFGEVQDEVPKKQSVSSFLNLFDAFVQGIFPFNHGYIISSFFSERNDYSIYEIVSYAGVKEIFPTKNGLQFVGGGKKLFVLLEHDSYHQKTIEPVHRAQGESIPKCFSELEIIISENQYRVMVAKEPNKLSGSFTIIKPTSLNFSILFDGNPETYETIEAFFEESLNKQRGVPKADAQKASQLISATVQKYMGF